MPWLRTLYRPTCPECRSKTEVLDYETYFTGLFSCESCEWYGTRFSLHVFFVRLRWLLTPLVQIATGPRRLFILITGGRACPCCGKRLRVLRTNRYFEAWFRCPSCDWSGSGRRWP